MSKHQKNIDQVLDERIMGSSFQQYLDQTYPNSPLARYGKMMRALRAKHAKMGDAKLKKALADIFPLFKWTDDDWFFERYRLNEHDRNEALHEKDELCLDGESQLLEGTERFLSAIRESNNDYNLYLCAKGACGSRNVRDGYLDELRAWVKAKEENVDEQGHQAASVRPQSTYTTTTSTEPDSDGDESFVIVDPSTPPSEPNTSTSASPPPSNAPSSRALPLLPKP